MKLTPGRYLRSEDNGHIFVYDEQTAKLPQMRVITITGEEYETTTDMEEATTEPLAQEGPSERDEWSALYLSSFGKKPHPRMRLERIKQAVESRNGNDSSASNS